MGGTADLAIVCALIGSIAVAFSSCIISEPASFKPTVDFTTLCDSSDAMRIQDIIEQHVRYTGSLDATAAWLKTQSCVRDMTMRTDDTLEIKFLYDGQDMMMRVIVANSTKR